jgi:uncharacterized protein (TIGR00369 family)
MDADDAWVPYYDLLGIEVTTIDDGYAAAWMELTDEHSAAPGTRVAHGGAVASLADSAGYWAVSSANGGALAPTVDLRLDYLAPGTDDLRAEAEVVRNGASVGTVDVLVEHVPDGAGDAAAGDEVEATDRPGDGETVALGRGTFKTGGSDTRGAWDEE